jgi:hypothetical protein
MPEARSRRLLAAIAIIYAVAALLLPKATFWSNDGGEKLLQVKEIVRSGPGLPAIPYDALGVEAAGSFRFSPIAASHAAPEGERLVPIVPLYFPLLSALPYRALGAAGLYVVPLASALLVLWLVLRVAERVFDSDTGFFCLAAAGLSSSIAFYGLTFWEHTLATAACTTGFYLLCGPEGGLREERGVAVTAGVALALGAWVRGEVLIVIAALSTAMLLRRDGRRVLPFLLAGVAAGLAPFWVCNALVYGNAFGPQVAGSEAFRQDSLADSIGVVAERRWEIVRFIFFDYGFGVAPGVALALASVVTPVWLGWGRPARFRSAARVWLAASIAVVALSLLRFSARSDLILASMSHTPLWVALPVLPLAFLRPRASEAAARGRFADLLLATALLALVGFALGLPSRGGLQWGPRYALVLFPVLVLCAGRGYQLLVNQAPGLRVLCWGLVAVGVLVQITGVALLAHKKRASAQALVSIRALAPAAVVTDVWWLPEDGADLYHEIPVYGFDSGEEFAELLARLRELGHMRIVLASRSDFRGAFESVDGIEMAESRQLRPARLASFDLNLHLLHLGSPPKP